jgi:thyroxine 5-deiodinase
MGALAGFASMVGDYAGRANFAVVYLEEAHPTDGWLYGAVEHFIPQHATLAARQAAAQVLQAELEAAWARLQLHPGGEPSTFPCSVLVDGMGNAASLAFGALPERLAVLVGGELRWLGGKGPENYSLLTARDALDTLLASGGAPA